MNEQTLTREPVPAPVDLHALVNLAPDGIFVADADGRYTFVNEAGCRLLGYRREEIAGKSILDLIPAEEAPRLRASKARMLEGASDVAEWRLRRKDGSFVPVEVSANILPDGRWLGFVRDISERQAHEAEREAFIATVEADRKRLRALLDTLPLGVLLFQPDGRLFFNRRTEDLLGIELSPDGGSAQYRNLILYPDGRPVPPERLPSTRVLRLGETVTGEEYLVQRPDGERLPILGSAAPIRDAEGRVVGGVGVFQDMSERMRMEKAIRDNARLLQAVFDILPVGVWIADGTGRIVRNNPAGERVWKGARYVDVPQYGEYKGWWADSGRPIAAQEWALARALTKGETSTGELVRIQCFDGSFKTIINSAAPLRDDDGAIAGAIVVNEDITALHEAQEKQRTSEQLLRTVIDLLPVGLWVADREGRITLANPAGLRIWQGTRYVGPAQYHEYKAWWVETGQPIAPEDWGLSRAVRKGETSRGELIRIQCFDGSFKTVINFAAPIRSDAGEIVGAVAVNEDITSLQQTQEQLRAAVRDREEILAIVTHDLRNPLAGLLMGATAAERQARAIAGGEPVRVLAAHLMDISRRMSGMVDDLLAVAVAGTGGESMLRLAPVEASALIAKASAAARPLLAREGLELKLEVGADLPPVSADADRILRVFANLLDNALKYTSHGGTITLCGEPVSGGVRFAVANSGPALPSKSLEAMFQPFWQAGRDRRGAGLGLAICRSIVEAHGGSIWAEPAEGQRVRVCFVLPRQPAASASRSSGVARPRE
ncbi:MAG TPA: PAS domain S-box protein [Burkholderiales bacterium]